MGIHCSIVKSFYCAVIVRSHCELLLAHMLVHMLDHICLQIACLCACSYVQANSGMNLLQAACLLACYRGTPEHIQPILLPIFTKMTYFVLLAQWWLVPPENSVLICVPIFVCQNIVTMF